MFLDIANWTVFIEYVLGGALVGAIVGATGVGGGSLMTPLLTLGFGLPPQTAVGTDLLFAAATKLGGAIAHGRRGNIHWPIAGWMTLGSVPASLVTIAALRAWHPDSAQFGAFVRPALAAALLLTAVSLLFRAHVQRWGRRFWKAESAESAAPADASPVRPAVTFALGAVIGVMVTLTSVGAGAVGVVALLFLYPALTAKRLVAVDIAHAVPLTLVAGLGHVALGTINWLVLLALLLGSVPAISLGALLADRLPEKTLRVLLAAMLTLVGARLGVA